MQKYSIAEMAKLVRDMGELTAKNSQNWENFEKICRDVIQAAYDAGKNPDTTA